MFRQQLQFGLEPVADIGAMPGTLVDKDIIGAESHVGVGGTEIHWDWFCFRFHHGSLYYHHGSFHGQHGNCHGRHGS